MTKYGLVVPRAGNPWKKVESSMLWSIVRPIVEASIDKNPLKMKFAWLRQKNVGFGRKTNALTYGKCCRYRSRASQSVLFGSVVALRHRYGEYVEQSSNQLSSGNSELAQLSGNTNLSSHPHPHAKHRRLAYSILLCPSKFQPRSWRQALMQRRQRTLPPYLPIYPHSSGIHT